MSDAKIDNDTGFKLHSHDKVFQQNLEKHISNFEIDAASAVFHFPILARRQWLKRFLAHTELFKRTLDVPGDILEIGVFRGLSLMTWANLLEIYSVGDRTKVVWGVDNWKGFQSFSEADGASDKNVGKEIGGFNPQRYFEELQSAISLFDSDRFVPWKERVRLLPGSAEERVENLLKTEPGLRFSLVHFDVDLYEPTLKVLKLVWPKIPIGGLLIFDEYGIRDWPGESAAVDEFLSDKPHQRLRTLSWTNTPGAYLIKQ